MAMQRTNILRDIDEDHGGTGRDVRRAATVERLRVGLGTRRAGSVCCCATRSPRADALYDAYMRPRRRVPHLLETGNVALIAAAAAMYREILRRDRARRLWRQPQPRRRPAPAQADRGGQVVSAQRPIPTARRSGGADERHRMSRRRVTPFRVLFACAAAAQVA